MAKQNENKSNEEYLRKEAERKARIEAEAKEKVQAELNITKDRRKPSPEEISVKNDTLMEVEFMNIESPGVTHLFTYGGKKFELKDGEKVKLPVCVVNHLNRLKVPVRKYDENAPEGKQVQITSMRNRFSCQPVNMQPASVQPQTS